MFKVYIADSIYQNVVASEEQKPSSDRSALYKVLSQQQVQVLDTSATAYIKDSPNEVMKNPSGLYILDVCPAEALAIRRNYGVLCVSADKLDISPLIDINDIHIAEARQSLGHGWDSVLDSVENLPSNALLLTDRYLFAFRKPSAGDGIANIHDILDELLPHQFAGGDYHVTVIFNDESKHASYTFNEIATELNKVKQQLGRDYPIMMEVLGITPDCSIYNKLHNRQIISNYFMVEADHKLAAFNGNIGTARQILLPLALFTESSLNGKSTPPLKAINQTLYTLREFSKSLSRLSDHSVYLYAVNGKRMERCMAIRNRLIK